MPFSNQLSVIFAKGCYNSRMDKIAIREKLLARRDEFERLGVAHLSIFGLASRGLISVPQREETEAALFKDALAGNATSMASVSPTGC